MQQFFSVDDFAMEILRNQETSTEKKKIFFQVISHLYPLSLSILLILQHYHNNESS